MTIRLCNVILKAVVKIINKEEDPEKALIFAMDMVMAIERYTCRRVIVELEAPNSYRMHIEE